MIRNADRVILTQGFKRMSDRVTTLVTEILARHGVSGDVGCDVELARLGLTSIDMVELMLGIEADFDLTIPPSDITTENFRSIASIQRLIERLLSEMPRDEAVAA